MKRVADLPHGILAEMLERLTLQLVRVERGVEIPGSYWGEDEAGLIGARLFVRDSTPVHSALHEACHFVCMDALRRTELDRDAGGDHTEENAVCYLQILLADFLPSMGRDCMLADMDAWGYTFRLGSARQWFEQDAEDAREWLLRHAIIDTKGDVTWRLRAA